MIQADELALSAAEELALELEGEQDRSRLDTAAASERQPLRTGRVPPASGAPVGRDAEIPWSVPDGERSARRKWVHPFGACSNNCGRGQLGRSLECAAAQSPVCADWFDAGLEEAVTNLLIRQKQVLVGKAYSPDSLISEPMTSKAIADRIARFSREDVRERVLTQEILLGLDGLMKLDPKCWEVF